MSKWTLFLGDKEIHLPVETIQEFRNRHILLNVVTEELASRISNLLWVDIYVLDQYRGISSFEILKSIKDEEAGVTVGRVKRPTIFKHPPLKGLWHLHFFAAVFLLNNVLIEVQNGVKLQKILEEEINLFEKHDDLEKLAEKLTQRTISQQYENRRNRGKLTGEWIVFAKFNDLNYYLCIGSHKAGDQKIFDRIFEHCTRDFPDLPNWISQGSS